jgi:molecular chaperone DnaJ
MSTDFYAALGVAPGASAAEIKQAYRQLARQFHPDKNPGDAAAADRFKDAAEAYRVLGDADLRADYDRHREGRARGGPSPEDFLDELFGTSAARRSAPPRAPPAGVPPRPSASSEPGQDLRYTRELELEDAALGCERQVAVPGLARCDGCLGTGARRGSAPAICGECSGVGTVRRLQGFFESSQRCSRCDGSGRLAARDCGACGGRGQVEQDRWLTVEVPAGVASGTRLKLAGEGLPGERGGRPGDLYVVVEVRPHALFSREGDDLVVEVPVSFAQAALGTELEIPTLEGSRRMRVPPGSQNGRVFRLARMGFVDGRGGRGDQRVRIVVQVPSTLTEDQRRLLDALADADEEAPELPRVAEFRQALRDLAGR